MLVVLKPEISGCGMTKATPSEEEKKSWKGGLNQAWIKINLR